jgi:GAF domain-containing protein
VAGDIQGGVDQTLEARADPYLEAHPTELRDRLAAIRGSTLAGVRNLTQDAGGGVAAQQVGAFMAMRPGLANVRETRDLATAQELAGRAGTALDNAATGKGQASPSTAKIEGMLTQILKALGALDRTTQKGNGF